MLIKGEFSIHAFIKGYHLCCSEVNVGKQFSADKKNRECRNVFKVTSEHGQLGHLQSDLVDGLFL